MIKVEQVKQLIEIGLPDSEVEVKGDGYHFTAVVVSDAFKGKSLLEQQRLVYACVNEQIISGELHALSVKTHAPDIKC